MKYIQISKGHQAIVDDEDFDELSKYNWFAFDRKGERLVYAGCKLNHKNVKMHRMVLGVKGNEIIDHKNGNGLDNRKENLRISSPSQNMWHRAMLKNNTSGFRGVSFRKNMNKWSAMIGVYRKPIYLGSFKTKEEAAKAYNDAAIKFFGEFANLNDI